SSACRTRTPRPDTSRTRAPTTREATRSKRPSASTGCRGRSRRRPAGGSTPRCATCSPGWTADRAPRRATLSPGWQAEEAPRRATFPPGWQAEEAPRRATFPPGWQAEEAPRGPAFVASSHARAVASLSRLRHLGFALHATRSEAGARGRTMNGVMLQFFHWYLPDDGSRWRQLEER